jgi:hypothetical protein
MQSDHKKGTVPERGLSLLHSDSLQLADHPLPLL